MKVRGFIGKIPSEGDFVRHNLVEPLPRTFDRWMAASAEAVASLRLSDLSDPLRFIFADGRSHEVLLGVLAPSHDAIGRTYPLAVFEHWAPARSEAANLSALPVAYQDFLESAAALVRGCADTSPAKLKSELESLPPVGSADHARAAVLCEQALDRTLASEFEARVFESPAEERHYAYHTLLTALALRARGGAFGSPPTIDCPMSTDVDQFAWLELVRRALGPTTPPPTVLWSEDEVPRMAVVLGAPGPLDYRFRSDDGRSERLWPLRTSSVPAREAARTRLHAIDPALDSSEGPLRALVERVARASASYAPGETA